LLRLNGDQVVFQIDIDGFDLWLSSKGLFNARRAETADHSVDGCLDGVRVGHTAKTQSND
jgi:hypothetical protein